MDKIKQHKHCTKCGDVIEYVLPSYPYNELYRPSFYELSVCKDCITKIGLDKISEEKYGKTKKRRKK